MNNEEKILSLLETIVSKIDTLETKIDKLEKGQANLEQRMDNLEIRQNENTDIIKAIKHATEYTNARMESLTITLAKVEGNTVAISKKINLIEAVTADNWNEIVQLKAVK